MENSIYIGTIEDKNMYQKSYFKLICIKGGDYFDA